ncbi:PSP1 domain-containing protein [Chondrinema litorale]|uniref:PSP1 domain-containing protein n=1 Tax=Chondrinema litorale TaxID=2994555 RepID=UPI0025435C3A|nr:regulatory iron-sulfur-containing complex subunit RicT [Chondrinema litorale]UZR94681.1 regulatory iron-sulfur-containing complex subunit RicT [Chondrinema litorale]
MNSFDWLSNMELPAMGIAGSTRFDVMEVKFKGGRKEFYKNVNDLDVVTGDAIIVDAQNGHHLGYVSLQGELVRLQMMKKKVKNDDKIKGIIRQASEKDLEKFERVRQRELPTLYRTRAIINKMDLKMKLSDVEFQADNSKATFYYSADDRVDFRELIKVIASEFKIRVEMRQISLRQEASRIGGIGSCGRELCCSTWLTEFKSVSTGAARYQNLSLNPVKLSGQCGRLKCCLNYELETYLDALVDIPKVETPVILQKGKASLQKVDIFKKIMWFCYERESNWFPLEIATVNAILKRNKEGKAYDLFVEETVIQEAIDFSTNILEKNTNTVAETNNASKAKRKRKKRRKKKSPSNKNNNSST